MDQRRRRRHSSEEGGSGMCPSRTFLLVAVLGCNIVLFVYNFPGLIGVGPSVTQFNSSWLDKKEVSDILQRLEGRIVRRQSRISCLSAATRSSPVEPPPPSAPIASLAPDIAVRTREGAGKLHLLSHRSCSQDQSAKCNQGFIKDTTSGLQERIFSPVQSRWISAAIVVNCWKPPLDSLPDELMNDPRWQTHVKPGVRGRGYWFWKATQNSGEGALSCALKDVVVTGRRQAAFELRSRMSTQIKWRVQTGDPACAEVLQLGDELLYVALLMCCGLLRYQGPDVILAAQPHCEHVWTKGDIFQRFGTTWDSLHYGLTQQPKAQAWLMRLNERTLKLLQIWEGLMTATWNKALDGPWFKRKENRHDQSILSMILKASVAKSGSCKEPDFPCDRLGSKDETAGWQVHPELGVPGLTVKYF
eukprot:s5_g66.t1